MNEWLNGLNVTSNGVGVVVNELPFNEDDVTIGKPEPLYENHESILFRDWNPQSALINIAFSDWITGLCEHK